MANTLETRTVGFNSETNASQQESYQQSNDVQPNSYLANPSTNNNISTPQDAKRVQVRYSTDEPRWDSICQQKLGSCERFQAAGDGMQAIHDPAESS